MRESDTMTERKENPSRDFLLLLTLFVAFRLGSVLFFRPGGYVRDYSDLIFYQSRASWQDFGFLPYRDYWSEYPPLFAWLTVGIDRIARLIPVWDDQRLWFAAFFGLLTVAAETLTLVALYRLARRIHGDGALRVAWLYAFLFLPVYLLGGWYDALPVATIIGALALLLSGMTAAPLLAGALIGLGGALEAGSIGAAGSCPAGPGALAGSLDHLGQRAGGHSRRLCHRLSQWSRHDHDLHPVVGGSIRVEHPLRLGRGPTSDRRGGG